MKDGRLMTEETSSHMIKRLLKMSLCSLPVIMGLIFVFTKSLFYSIIFFLGAIVSILGFLAMIKITDRILNRGKGQWFFFLAFFFQLAVIAVIFYPVARHSKGAVLFFILGLSLIVLAIFMEAIYQLSRKRSASNG